MGKNLTCPKCGSHAYHIQRTGNGEYQVFCMKAGREGHPIPIKLVEDTLNKLKN